MNYKLINPDKSTYSIINSNISTLLIYFIYMFGGLVDGIEWIIGAIVLKAHNERIGK